jgi:phosphatidyl-myo-inositol dimannoside synthase
MKVLFIARTYPPKIGGMQRFCSDFYHNYRKLGNIDLLANTDGYVGMPIFVLKLLFALIFRSRKYDVIHFSDAVLSPMIVLGRLFSRAKISFTVHGLDIVYSRFGYQKFILPFLKKADKVFAVSQHTREQCEQRGVPDGKLMVIPNCINSKYFNLSSQADQTALIKKFDLRLGRKKVLLTVGRLIKRKGHLWFLSQVFNRLPDDYVYIIVGTGAEYDAIKHNILTLGLSDKVYMLGHVSEDEKKCLYQIADLFIMPNIRVKGDQEGFGIVLLEAGGYGLPVIASNLEGIRDVVFNGKTGYLIDEQDSQAFLNAITSSVNQALPVKDVVIANFECGTIINAYYTEFIRMIAVNIQGVSKA